MNKTFKCLTNNRTKAHESVVFRVIFITFLKHWFHLCPFPRLRDFPSFKVLSNNFFTGAAKTSLHSLGILGYIQSGPAGFDTFRVTSLSRNLFLSDLNEGDNL